MTFIRTLICLVWLSATLTENRSSTCLLLIRMYLVLSLSEQRKRHDESSTHRMLIAQSTTYAAVTHAVSNLSKLHAYL